MGPRAQDVLKKKKRTCRFWAERPDWWEEM